MENVLVLPSVPLAARGSRALVWTGRALTSLVLAFLLVDAIAKLIPLAPVIEATQKLGYAVGVIRPLGMLLALSTLLHVFARTQFLGAVLVTAYLGGATATLVRAGTPFWFPVAMGVTLWIAYSLRSARLRAFFLSPAR